MSAAKVFVRYELWVNVRVANFFPVKDSETALMKRRPTGVSEALGWNLVRLIFSLCDDERYVFLT